MPRISMAEKASRVLTVKPARGVKQRKAVLNTLNDALRQKLATVESMLAEFSQNSIMFNYELGTVLKEVRLQPNKFGGESAMKALEAALPGRADLLRRAVQFAIEMTKADAEQLAGLENGDAAFRLNWGHIIVLLTLKNQEQRLAFARRAVHDLLDPGALHKLIQSKTGKKHSGGRPHKLPNTVPAQLRQVMSKTSDWVAKHEELWDGDKISVFSNMLECAPNDVDVEMLDNAKATRDALTKMAELAQKDIETFDKIIERIENCLRNEV